MKLLVVSQYFWPENFRINEVVRSLVEKGVEVDVLTAKPNYPEGAMYEGYVAWGSHRESWEGANVYRVPIFPRGVKRAWRLALNYLSFVVAGLSIGPWLLRRQQYDVIFVYGLSPILLAIPAIFIARIKRRKLVLWVQDLWPDSLVATGYVRNPTILRLVERVVRWIYRHSDLLLVQSRAFEKSIAQLVEETPIRYYPNSVEAMFCKPTSPDVKLPEVPALDDGYPVIFAGNLGAAQAVEVIVDAAEQLLPYSEIRLVILGNGSRWDWMKEQVTARGLTNLHLVGRFPVDTMPGLMQKAGALLVSLTEEPIFAVTVPNKVQAYMAAGRPILASLNGEGARLIQEAEAGICVPAGDATALAEAVFKLYSMPEAEREIMGTNGRKYFKTHFDHDKLIDELMAHLNQATNAQRSNA